MHLEVYEPTKSAILVCEDRRGEEINGAFVLTSTYNPARCGCPTKHVYEGVRDADKGVLPTQEVLYRCTVCGNVRRWGMV